MFRCSSVTPSLQCEATEAVKIVMSDSDDEERQSVANRNPRRNCPKDSHDPVETVPEATSLGDAHSVAAPGSETKSSTRTGVTRKHLGSLKLMSRLNRTKVTSPTLQTNCLVSPEERSASLPKSSSLPSLEMYQSLDVEENTENVKDEATSGAKQSQSYNWGKLGSMFVSPAAAVSVDDSNSKAKGAPNPTAAELKSQQAMLFHEEMREWKAKKKRAILNTIKNPFIKVSSESCGLRLPV